MTRRKSVCLKWTLVLLVVVFCPSVHLRPQEPSVVTTSSADEKSANPIRYRFTHSNLSISSFKAVPTVISFSDNNRESELDNDNNTTNEIIFNNVALQNLFSNNSKSFHNRTSRLSRDKYETKKKYKPRPLKTKSGEITNDRKKPAIRKVITKWRDKTKYDDLDFSHEVSASNENDKPIKLDNKRPNDDTSTESASEKSSKRYTRPPDMYYNGYNQYPQYSEESQVYSPNIQIIGNPRPQRPYIYANVPTPTPVITNVGYPKPWVVNRKTTTQRPTHATRPLNYDYHNNINSYSGSNYEVATFEPANSYTEKIVIRPQEYSPHSEDCPTIFLTLNNTFQGQAKEACPDLNIAVNTNVINKNVVIESEEEEADSLFPGGFGLGLGDDSSTDEATNNDYFGSDENQEQEDSASVEGTELANYHSANSVVQAESEEPGSLGAAASPISAIIKPGRPSQSDDDIFGFSSLIEFFKPAFSALGWLTSINPFSIGLFPLLLAPLGFLFAGSGFAALFAPWIVPYGREAPKVIHVYRPQWHWDDTIKAWHLHSFPNNKDYITNMERSSKELKPEINLIRPTLFSKIRDWMRSMTNKLRNNIQKQKDNLVVSSRKNKRRKRETWTIRVK